MTFSSPDGTLTHSFIQQNSLLFAYSGVRHSMLDAWDTNVNMIGPLLSATLLNAASKITQDTH